MRMTIATGVLLASLTAAAAAYFSTSTATVVRAGTTAATVTTASTGSVAVRATGASATGASTTTATASARTGTSTATVPKVAPRLIEQPAIGRKQYMIITSDPQFPWTPHMDNPNVPAARDEEKYSRDLITEQYDSISRFSHGKDVLGTFINGDLTAYGHWWQIDTMKGLLYILNQPVYLGLGNHDYVNNINDCAENWCARGSLYWFVDHMSKLSLDAFDVKFHRWYEFPSNREEMYGSLAWSATVGPLRVIQLNVAPEYTVKVNGWNFGRALREHLNVRSSMAWAEQQMADARRRGQEIIVMMHYPDVSPALAALLSRYEVRAVFAGHTHDAGHLGDASIHAPIPLFVSGSASKRTYLIAEIDPATMDMTVYQVRGNNPDAKTLLHRLPLSKREPTDEKVEDEEVDGEEGGEWIGGGAYEPQSQGGSHTGGAYVPQGGSHTGGAYVPQGGSVTGGAYSPQR